MAVPSAYSNELQGLCLRSLTPQDGMRISRILAESPEAAPWSADSLEDAASSGMTVWVAELNREVEGFLVGRLAAGEFEILNMAVSKAQRKNGIASRLLALALEWAQGAGGTRALLEVRASNEEAIRLYQRHGFAAWGRRKQYYRNPLEDALLFARTLAGHF